MVSEEYIKSIAETAREKENIEVPLPTKGHAVETVYQMIKNSKRVIKIFIDDIKTSVFNDPKIIKVLKKRKQDIIEGGLPPEVPGYFAIFDDGYIFQKDKRDGFHGVGNFNDKKIADSMRFVWDILNERKEKAEKK